MSYLIRCFHLTLLPILLFSCTVNPPSTEDTSALPALTLSPPKNTFYLDRSALSYGIYETEATSLTIEVENSTPEEFSAFADISIDDGVNTTTYRVKPGQSSIFHSLSPGKKRITITSGGQAKINNEMTGVFIKKIIFSESAVQMEPSGKRILIYGDSLAVGGNVNHPSAEAWPVLLRKQYVVSVDACGYRTLYDDASTSIKRAEFASKMKAWKPDYIWFAIGANDYGFNQWSAEDFGKAYAALLDAVHSSDPQVTLFAQSPILRTNESKNSFGDNLETYRQQIAAACQARSSWCIFVNGKDSMFPQPDELDKDGIHLTTGSSANYASAVLHIMAQYR